MPHKGYKMPDDARRRISETMKGRKKSDITRQRMSSALKGRVIGDEWKKRISISKTGKKLRPFTEEHKRRLSLSQKGRVFSEEHRKNLTAARNRRFQMDFVGTSASEKLFLDALENIYGVSIQRQFQIGISLFDGRVENHLIEVDGDYWHSYDTVVVNDIFKGYLAKSRGYKLHRFTVNSVAEVESRLVEYREELDKIFGNPCKH